MNNVIRDLPGVTAYLDDILVTGDNEGEHRTRLDQLLNRLDKWNYESQLVEIKILCS